MTILTEKKLAEELDISYWTVRRMRTEKGMPYLSIGKRIFYNYDSVCQWISKQETTATVDKSLQYGCLRQIM